MSPPPSPPAPERQGYWFSQISAGVITPLLMGWALAPFGRVEPAKFCTWRWAATSQMARFVQR